MALSITTNTAATVDVNHTVAISAGSNVTAATVADSHFSKTSYTLTPNSGVESTVATITFTPLAGFYYYKEPKYNIKSPYPLAYKITETLTRDSIGRVVSKVFVIKYTNTVNSFGDVVVFDHETKALPATVNTLNLNTLLEIKSFKLDTTEINSIGSTRSFVVNGDAKARFNLKITRNTDSKTYDFNTGSFTTTETKLENKLIGSKGVFEGKMSFPAITADEVYSIELSPNLIKGTTLNSKLEDSTSQFSSTTTIKQNKPVTVTLTLASTAYSGSYGTLPDNVTFVAEKNFKGSIKKRVSWDLVLSANSFTFARGYGSTVGAINDIDVRSSIVKVKNANQAEGTTVLLDDVNQLALGMAMTGTGVTGSPRVTAINLTAKSVDVSVLQAAQGEGGIANDATLTFTYGGSETSKLISGFEFELPKIDNKTGFINNAVSLTPVTTAVNNASGIDNSATVVVDSANGIKAAATTFVSGLGIDAKTAAPHVDGVSSATLTLSAAQTLADNTPLVFTGSSRSANITFDIIMTSIGTKDPVSYTHLTLPTKRIV